MNCTVPNCPNPPNVPGSARGLCRAHYKRWYRYGSEHEPPRKVVSWAGEVCSETGCGKPVKVHGLCVNHYPVMRRRTNPAAQAIRNKAFKARRMAKQDVAMGRPRPSHCELCGEAGTGKYGHKWVGIVFDHCHESDMPRGWLCDRCNKVLGLVEDKPDLLRQLADYLEAHRGKAIKQAA